MGELPQQILFYDGECGLCSRSVRFLIRRDREGILQFAPLQGETARKVLSEDLRESLSTLVYRRSADDTLLRSTAVLPVFIDLRSGWRSLARPAQLVPVSWRDAVYKLIARNRHRFFPKNNCPMLDETERKRLLP